MQAGGEGASGGARIPDCLGRELTQHDERIEQRFPPERPGSGGLKRRKKRRVYGIVAG